MNKYKPEDYRVVVRSYKRHGMFKQMTYKMLVDNGIDVSERLYIVVANEEERELYAEALWNLPYKEIIVAEIGGHKAIEHSVKKFPEGYPLVFMDDDLEYFFEFTDKPEKENFVKQSSNLERYLLDGFNSLKDGREIFSFSFYKNDFYIKEKPFKEFRPYNIPGGFFGVLNSEKIITDHAHLDDIHRTCRYIDKTGGCLIYNWCGFETNTGNNPGGMQASGDRGDEETRMQVMKEMCERVYDISYVKKFCKEPKVAYTGMWEVKLKSIVQIKKLRNFDHLKWDKYFQSSPNDQNKLSLEEFM